MADITISGNVSTNNDVTLSGSVSLDNALTLSGDISAEVILGWVKWGNVRGDMNDQEDLTEAFNTRDANLNTHVNNKNNPHEVTKSQVGLGNVDNTSDANKPISTATQNALDLKANTSDLYTKAEIDNKDTVVLNTAESDATLKDNAVKSWADAKFLTEHQSLSAYRTSAAQDVIDNNLSTRITTNATNITTLDTGKADKSTTYTKTEVDTEISNHHDDSKYDASNPSGYITSAYHDSSKQDKLTVNPSSTTSTLTGLTIDGTAYKIEAGGGTGSVTSITAGAGLTGGTITTSGTIAVDTNTIATKEDIIDLDTIRANATAGQSAYQTIHNTYGDIVTHNASEFATSAQGSLADSAIQPNDNVSDLTNDAGYITSSALDFVITASNVTQTTFSVDKTLTDVTAAMTAGRPVILKVTTEDGNNYSLRLSQYKSSYIALNFAFTVNGNNKVFQLSTDGEGTTYEGYITDKLLNSVSVDSTGSAIEEVSYITIDGIEKKLAGGVSDFDDLSNRPQYNGSQMTSSTNIPEVKTSAWDSKTVVTFVDWS